MEIQQFGIDVSVIEPGGIDSEWAEIAFDSAKKYSSQGAYDPLLTAMLNLPILKRKMPTPTIITDPMKWFFTRRAALKPWPCWKYDSSASP